MFRYFEEVAPLMEPALEGRPLVQGAPDWLTTVDISHEERTLTHVVVDRPESLLWLANPSALTPHMGSSQVPRLEEPDWVVFDLDPGPQGTFEDLILLATSSRRHLEALGLVSVPKASGKRGLHVLVPLARGHTHARARAFAQETFEALGREHPELATPEHSKSRRAGRLYLDAGQNAWGKTVVAPYALRALPHAPVSTPLAWSEVTRRLDPTRFTLATPRRRLDRVGDLFAPAREAGQRLPRRRGPLGKAGEDGSVRAL